jgi:hypothetical protein
MIFNQVSKRVKLERADIVKYQLLTHFYLEKINVSQADLECLTMLVFNPEIDLTDFCNHASDEGIFKTPQSVRNAVSRFERMGVIDKAGKSRKVIKVSDKLNIQSQGNVLLDYKFVSIEPEEVQGNS